MIDRNTNHASSIEEGAFDLPAQLVLDIVGLAKLSAREMYDKNPDIDFIGLTVIMAILEAAIHTAVGMRGKTREQFDEINRLVVPLIEYVDTL